MARMDRAIEYLEELARLLRSGEVQVVEMEIRNILEPTKFVAPMMPLDLESTGEFLVGIRARRCSRLERDNLPLLPGERNH